MYSTDVSSYIWGYNPKSASFNSDWDIFALEIIEFTKLTSCKFALYRFVLNIMALLKLALGTLIFSKSKLEKEIPI